MRSDSMKTALSEYGGAYCQKQLQTEHSACYNKPLMQT